jgi:hypothetical protein
VNAAGALLLLAVIAFGPAACVPVGEPTRLPAPDEAIDVRQFKFLEGRAHQTDFTLRVAYPDDRVFQHYVKTIGKPWIRCDWAPNWDSHLDGTMTPVHTVHQQMHTWVNRDAGRAIAVAARYYSAGSYAPKPLNDYQKVAVVEYIGVNVDDYIRTLQLRCPGN